MTSDAVSRKVFSPHYQRAIAISDQRLIWPVAYLSNTGHHDIGTQQMNEQTVSYVGRIKGLCENLL